MASIKPVLGERHRRRPRSPVVPGIPTAKPTAAPFQQSAPWESRGNRGNPQLYYRFWHRYRY